jgi:putative membrane protein
VSDVIEKGRLHPITPLRRAWLQVSIFVWLAWDHLDECRKLADRYGVWGIVGASALLVALIGGLVFASWRKTEFTLSSTHLDYHYGMLYQVHRRIPLDQIRTVDVEHPLFGRPLGVRAMSFGTASKSTKLAYLGPKTATRLHDAVVTQTGAVSAKHDENVIARVTPAQLALSILLDAQVMIGLVIGGLFSFLPFILFDHAVTLGLVLPWVRSAWRATGKRFPQQHGWVVREVEAGYRTEHGLFNKQQNTWQADRISSITLHQPTLWKSRNWVRVTGGVVGYDDATLIPVTTRAQAEKMLVRMFGPDVLKLMDNPVQVSRRARWCTPWWRACAFSHSPEFVAGWRGLFLRQTVTIAPMTRVLAVEVEQGPWQRVHGVAHIVLKLPGGTDVEAVNRDKGDAKEIADMMRKSAVRNALNGVPILRRGPRSPASAAVQ